MKNDVKEIIRLVAEGNKEAFAELVGMFKKQVYAVAFRMLGNHLDADEVTQETFVRIYDRRHELKAVSYISGFIIRIATNYAIDLLRKKRKKFVDVDDLSFLPDDQMDLSEKIIAPDQAVQDSEIMAKVIEGMAELPPKQRAAFILHDLQGFTKSEIADALGCPQATVRSNLHIARTKLRKWLSKRM